MKRKILPGLSLLRRRRLKGKFRTKAGYNLSYEWIHNDPKLPVLVLLNGSLFGLRQWDVLLRFGFAPHLKRKYRILRYDYGGTGLSPRGAFEWDVPMLAEELRELLDGLNVRKAHIYGLSKGTIISQMFAYLYPERVLSLGGYGWFHFGYTRMAAVEEFFSLRLQHFAYLGSRPFEALTRKEFNELWDEVYRYVLSQNRALKGGWIYSLLKSFIRRKVYQLVQPTPVRVMYDWFSYGTRMLPQAAAAFDEMKPELEKIPMLIQHSRKDGTLPLGMARELSKAVSGSRLIEYGRGYNHVSVSVKPRQASKVIYDYAQFLKRISLKNENEN